MLELQNDDIYELVIDNSYFIFIGNDSFNEEIDYFRKLSIQQPFSIITDCDNQYSKLGEVLLSADTKSNKDAFINDVIERISKVDNIFIFSDMSTDEVAKSVFGNFSFYSYKKACGQKKTVRGSKNSRRLSNGTPAI